MLSAMPALRLRVARSLRANAFWCAILAAGLLLRLWFLAHQMTPDDDTDVYTELAGNLFHHGIYGIATNGEIDPTLIRLPGYPLFLALVFRVFGWGNIDAVLAVQIAIDLLGCWLIASFVREQVSRRAGTVALALAALCPFTAAYAATALTECLSVFAVSLAVWSAGRLLQAQAGGRGDRSALLLASLAMALAMLLRPDGALIAATVVAAIVWYAWRKGTLRSGFKTALLCGVLAALPLAPWAARNWVTFHVFQPLAPRRVNDPGEYVTYGFYRWMNTWSVDIVSTGAVFWNAGTDTIDIHDLPSRAFDSPAQRAETAELLDRYNATKTITPELDARFARLARERVRAHPLRCLVWVPFLRVADMFLRPRTETLTLKPDWWRFQAPPLELFELAVLGSANVALVALALWGLARGRVPWPALAVVYLVVRCALLSTMENSEPRYTLEALPVLTVCAACALAGRRWKAGAAIRPAAEPSAVQAGSAGS
jgi:4-amino-4-deoxy-L-arabinose transferase-like glycosyltransferase